ncbi:orotate phosphoribosyltransferase [Scopulibacillus daqui]|uniref:Orotate phosphoribosyltransferase n=1 Tax=Scopulibacillus daqui TaxID=1469162 RepID=A0ABS2PXS9_9BACL|nr:orotate phosphoribosyltransferase [Scopulibacillus daqui]MBM7644299.1 orotate phosphoribosyltransferase [Scopulibacillus daqui]
MNEQMTIAEKLLDINAVILKPNDPFTWSSGLKAPIYCDNRLTLSYPKTRKMIADSFVKVIKENYPEAEVIAGTATAGIPHAAWISERLDLPMAYVRGSAKGHGKKKQIEGQVLSGQKVVIIEDLISTGGSVIKAAEALKAAGAMILGVAAIFSYQLPKAAENLEAAGLNWTTLTDFKHLIELAVNKKIVDEQQLEQLKLWHQNPESEEWYFAENAGGGIR